MTIASTPVFVDVIRPRPQATAWYEIMLVVTGTALIAASAQLAIPLGLSPVPITGQTFAILLVGALYGARRGALTVMVYLLEGAAGLPVFAALSAGAGHLVGPTGGYLVGFVPAAYVVGALSQRGWDRYFMSTIAAMIAGTLVIFIVGAGWLATFIDPGLVIRLGVVPFLPGAAIKIALAALLLPTGWRILARVRTGRSDSRRDRHDPPRT